MALSATVQQQIPQQERKCYYDVFVAVNDSQSGLEQSDPGTRSSSTGEEKSMALHSQESAVGDGVPGRSVEKTAKCPKSWKQFLITVAGVYPLTVVIPIALTWLSHFLAPLRVSVIRGVVSATLLVTCLLFVALPLFNRVFRRRLVS